MDFLKLKNSISYEWKKAKSDVEPFVALYNLIGCRRFLFPITGLGIRKALERRRMTKTEIESWEDYFNFNGFSSPAIIACLSAAINAILIMTIASVLMSLFPQKDIQIVISEWSAYILALSVVTPTIANLARIKSHIRIFNHDEIIKLLKIQAQGKALLGNSALETYKIARDEAAKFSMSSRQLLKCLQKSSNELTEQEITILDSVMKAVVSPIIPTPTLEFSDNLVESLVYAGACRVSIEVSEDKILNKIDKPENRIYLTDLRYPGIIIKDT